jgi:predicted ATPase
MGERSDAYAIFHGLWVYHIVRGEFELSRSYGQQSLDLARDSKRPEMEVCGLFITGASLFHLGNIADAADRMERGLSLHGGEGGGARLFGTPDVAVFCRAYLTHVLWMLGRVDDAEAESERALSEGRAAANPFTTVIALNYASMLRIFRRESAPALALARESVEFCRRHGFAYYLSMAEILEGWAETFEGDAESGAANIRRGLAGLRDTDAQIRLPFYLGLLAEACAAAGRTGEAMAHIANAFAFESKNRELWTLAELHRIHGDLLMRQDPAAAKAEYGKALEWARRTGSHSNELRAAARLEDATRATGTTASGL